jgi:hypothetical protein
MVPYVDIEGSGEDLTVIKGQVDGNTSSSGVVKGASHAELRFLSVIHTGGGIDAIGISNRDASPKITAVSVSSSGASTKNIGVYNDNAFPHLRGLHIVASGGDEAYGVWNADSSPVMIDGDITAQDAALKNYGVFNKNSGELGPVMEYLTIRGAGGNENFGVHDASGKSVMRYLTVAAVGGKNNTGVENVSSAAPVMHMVSVRTEGGTGFHHGVYNSDAAPEIFGGSIWASGGTSTTGLRISKDILVNGLQVTARNGSLANIGITCYFSSPSLIGVNVVAEGSDAANTALSAEASAGIPQTVIVSHSVLTAEDYSIYLGGGGGAVTMNVGATQLNGPVHIYGNYNCTGCYDGGFAALGTDCQ